MADALTGAVRRVDEQQIPPQDTRHAIVDFRVLGPLEATVAGRPVELGAPKQRALLALLISRVGQPVAVDVMLEALWSGHPPPSAMTSLQAYVANLRRVLEPDRMPRTPPTVLRTFPRAYLLDGRVTEVDVQRFAERAAAGRQARDRGDPQVALSEFDAGLALWRGQAYAEVANATCVAPEVSRLEELRLSVIELRCAALLAVGAHELAVAELEAFIQGHPLREYGGELLSLALYRAGRQADALGVLRTIQGRLDDELGIDPGPALKQLERDILHQSPDLDWQPVPAMPTAEARGGPAVSAVGPVSVPVGSATDGECFVGREDELLHLLQALAAAGAGRGRVVTVTGEQGVGKTSLLRRFAEVAGVPVLWATSPEHVAAPPLWLWEQVLRAVVAHFPQQVIPAPVAELLDADGGPLPAGGAAGVLRRYEAIVRYLTETSRAAPLVVLLDHLHRADRDSVQLLAHLADSVPASRLLLVVSYRSDEASSLAALLAALALAGGSRVELTGLDVTGTRTLAGAVRGTEVDRHTAERLRARTDGNPFFVRELVAQNGDVGVGTDLPVPVREVVLRSFARLPPAAAEVLAVAAVVGRHFDIEVVASAASVDVEAALAAVDTAIGVCLVVEDQRRLGWFRFAPSLAAEVLYESTGRLRRALVHRRVGEAAERLWAGKAELAAETARHWLLAAELDPTVATQAAGHATTAAIVADDTGARDAVALWRKAATAAELAEPGTVDRHPLLIGLGTALYRAGDPGGGLAVFVQALTEQLDAADPLDRFVATAMTAVGELDCHPELLGPVRGRLAELFDRALPRLTDPVQRVLVDSCRAVLGAPDDAPALPATAEADLRYLRALAMTGPDRLDQRLTAVTELLDQPDLPAPLAARARLLRAQALDTLGRAPQAAADRASAAELLPADAPLRTRLAWARAGSLLLHGEWQQAEECGRAARDRHPDAGPSATVAIAVQRWEAAFLRGRGAELVDELSAAAEALRMPAVHAVLAVALVEAGRTDDARRALRQCVRGARDLNDLWLYTQCWALLAAVRLDDTALVQRLRTSVSPHRELACAALDVVLSGPVAYFTAEAALCLGDWRGAVVELAVAAATAERMAAGPWSGRVREATVRAHRRTATEPAGRR